MSHRFDATLKDILTPQPEDMSRRSDCRKFNRRWRLNVDLSTITAATDVAIGFGGPIQEIVDLNFQSGPDPDVPARCHLYSAALNFRFGVPIRTILILLRPKADASQITGNLTYASGASSVEFRYEVIRMWQRPLSVFLHGGFGLLPLAPLCQMDADRPLEDSLREVVQEIDRRLANECEHAKAVRLMTAAFILSGLRVPLDSLEPIFEGVRLMHETMAWDYYLEEGARRGTVRVLLRLGQKRLGAPDEATVLTLNKIRDLDRLERLSDAILTATSWQELLATP